MMIDHAENWADLWIEMHSYEKKGVTVTRLLQCVETKQAFVTMKEAALAMGGNNSVLCSRMKQGKPYGSVVGGEVKLIRDATRKQYQQATWRWLERDWDGNEQ
jgi:hypothetical protein